METQSAEGPIIVETWPVTIIGFELFVIALELAGILAKMVTR
jgi:hypothetical protein